MNRTDRLYALVEELRGAAPDYRSASQLAEHFEVSTRTIERDLSALQQSGVPIYAVTGRRGGYALDTAHTLPPLNFSAGEVAAIATALAAQQNGPFTASGRAALRKILAVLGDVDARQARELAERVHLYDVAPPRPRPPSVVEHAIVNRRVLTLDYTDRNGAPTDRIVEPLGVVGVAPNWYLWAWCRLRDAPRAFRLDRINGAVMHDEVAPMRHLDPAVDRYPHAAGRSLLGDD
ncbi:MAG: WYL domain-containing protein [Actinomycetota bacterium]